MSGAPAPAWYRWEGADLLLQVRVQPRARADALAGLHGGRLKVRIAAPPVDGRANAHLCAFLAVLCGVPVARVAVTRGDTGRDKTLRISAPLALPDGVTR